MSRAGDLARAVWRDEPVLTAAIPSVLVTVGVITTIQANALTAAIGSLAAGGAELAVAFGARSQVTPVRKPAPPAETPAP